MLRGLRKKWKQPVAYYLIRGSTKDDMLVNFLMEVLHAGHNAGLKVVATVCNMGANNVKALKQFGVSEKTHFFRFQNQEIAAIFDLHLLKHTRNLFLKHDVANVDCEITVNVEGLTGTAKGEDILKLYEVDKRNVYRLLPKETERYMKPVAQSSMRVSVAAQVMRLHCEFQSYVSGVVWCSYLFPFISFYRILGHEGNFYHSNINCRLHGQQVSINSCIC
jgi:hypothetical protein